jgi:hypothetical protein
MYSLVFILELASARNCSSFFHASDARGLILLYSRLLADSPGHYANTS